EQTVSERNACQSFGVFAVAEADAHDPREVGIDDVLARDASPAAVQGTRAHDQVDRGAWGYASGSRDVDRGLELVRILGSIIRRRRGTRIDAIRRNDDDGI